MVVIDDNSTDHTPYIIRKFKNHPQITVLENKGHHGAMENHITCIAHGSHRIEDIIVQVDGDDWLASNDVLEYLNNIYQDPNIWVTYGEYKSLTSNPSQNKKLTDTRRYRKSCLFYTSHLRTFKSKIWRRINNSDFKDMNGNYFMIACDLAMMYPIIEMAGIHRIKQIEKILYVYNDINKLNDFKVNMQLLEKIRDYIWAKDMYDEIVGGV
jgi:glycosyltransferase involved in cell wall biosynthesis